MCSRQVLQYCFSIVGFVSEPFVQPLHIGYFEERLCKHSWFTLTLVGMHMLKHEIGSEQHCLAQCFYDPKISTIIP